MTECSKCQSKKRMLSEGIQKENISARVEAGEAGGGRKIKDP